MPEETARQICPEYLIVKALHDARKKKIETLSRLSTGFLILSVWNLAYLLGTFYQQLVPIVFTFFVFYELRKLKRDPNKDHSS